jgi:hypothetical protein
MSEATFALTHIVVFTLALTGLTFALFIGWAHHHQ